MAKKRKREVGRQLNSRKIAGEWLSLGIQPVPIKRRSKAPKSGKGWNTLKVTRETIPRFFNRGDNIGGLWGEPSGWVVDVDLDWDEASAVAPYLLPESFIYGRQTRPCSHYLYRVEGVSGSKRTLKSGSVIVEIRSTGSQSVLPPSIHPDNERYEINHDIPFKTLSRVELERYVNEVAIAALFIRHFPDKGSRHDYIHSLTGALLWSGWEEKRVRNFLKAFLQVTSDYDDDLRQRERTVRNTIEHFREGDRIAGWKVLSNWVPGDVIQRMRQWVTASKKYEKAPSGKKEDIEPGQIIPTFDNNLLDVPGLVGEIAKWQYDHTYLKQPAFDLAVALMIVALTSCNKYIVQHWETPLQPYFLLMAPTSAGKGATLKGVYDFARRMKLDEYCFQGFQSYHSMLDQLSTAPNMGCWLWDEAARKLAASRSSQSFDAQVITWILSLYGMANSYVPGLSGRKNPVPPLDRPFLTIMATAQPTQLVEAVSTSDLATGLINRFILFDSGDKAPEANWERTSVFPSALKKKALTLKKMEPSKETITIKFEETKTYAIFRDFDTESREKAAREEENQIWGRANQNALMMAGIVAVGVDPRRPVITSETARWAVSLIRWSIGCWLARIGESASRSRREGQSKKVESYIRKAASLRHRAGGSKKYRSLMVKGQMPRPVLTRLCRNLDSRELNDIVDQLIEADLIGASEDDDGLETYWPKS